MDLTSQFIDLLETVKNSKNEKLGVALGISYENCVLQNLLSK